jgi:hypothetical protein
LTYQRYIILGFTLENGLVLQAIVARVAAYQRTVCPIVEGPADIFPHRSCHRGKVALGDLLLDDNAPLADVTTKLFSQTQQRARNAALNGKKARGCHGIVGVAQTTRQQRREITVELRPGSSKRLEGGAADKYPSAWRSLLFEGGLGT